MKLLFYPTFDSVAEFTDHFYRAHWYLYPLRNKITEIVIPRHSPEVAVGLVPDYLDDGLCELKGNLPVSFFTARNDAQLNDHIASADVIFRWSVDPKRPNAPSPALAGKTVINVDHRHVTGASSYYLMFARQFPNLQTDYLARSRQGFKRIRERCTSDIGYVFGTGPGLSKAKEHDFSDGVSIACNSMVRNRDLMDRLQPPLIVVADPIFHAGPSTYARAFRDSLVAALDRYGSDLIVPMRDYHIYLEHLPERFADSIVALPFKAGETPNLDLEKEYHVTTTSNVLTLFLLPLAATFFNEIRIFGCDGRPLKENNYFWGHDKASQFNDEMGDIKKAHPGFFNLDYNDYYLTHCETLARWLNAAEAGGKKITNWTPSYIPALQSRSVAGLEALGEPSPSALLSNARNLEFNSARPAVSVIMPAFNAAPFIEEAVRSVQDQDLTAWELIIVEDGSTDDTLEKARKLAHEDERIQVLENPKKGVSAARNAGIRAAKGELIAFLDADDKVDPGSLASRASALLEKPSLQLVHGELRQVDEQERALGQSVGEKSAVSFRDMWKNAASLNTIMGRASFVKQFEFDETLGNGEDWLFFARMLRTGVHSEFVKNGSAIWRLRSNSTTAGAMREHVTKLSRVLDWLYSPCHDENIPPENREGLDSQPRAEAEFMFRRGLLVWSILSGDSSAAVDALQDIKQETRFLDKGRRYWLSAVKASAVRYFRKPADELGKIDEPARALIFSTSAKLGLRAEAPHLAAALCEIFGSPISIDRTIPSLEESVVPTRDDAVQLLPSYLRMPIFLPTERIPLDAQASGIQRVARLYSTRYLENEYKPRLQRLKSMRRAKRCFVIGNGPSLNSTDLTKLKNEITFATNGFFLKMPTLDWTPTYYVVEDHLVAEDRAKEINALHGPTKLFPAYLRYVLEPDEETIFFDHRPRKSFPDGFDFSFDADVHTYAGGTVTFTCLQLAAYLGYEEIYLIGVDANYAIPEDATLSGSGRVKEIDMKSDDPNHFHPNYFGKGKRWHEPNVDVMVKAYKEARRVCDARGVKICNATVGGKLEVFPRVDYDSLFDAAALAPRVLLIDHTRIADGSATGEVKSSLFAEWPAQRMLQIFSVGFGSLGLSQEGKVQVVDARAPNSNAHIAKRIAAFRPEVILYRPVPLTSELHACAMNIIRRSNIPLALWIMDDWPTSLAESNPDEFSRLDKDLRALFAQSARRFSISEAMSGAFAKRYGVTFEAFANGVDPSEWRPAQRRENIGTLRLRYAGSLAENMTLWSLRQIANAVEELAAAGVDIMFEIKTRELWRNAASFHFEGLSRTSFIIADLPPEEYREWLAGADIVVIAYNFDATSKDYVRYSLANKLPECLASGAALFAFGPRDVATIALLEKHDCGFRLTEENPALIKKALADLVASPEKRFTLADKAQKVAFEKFDIRKTRRRFATTLSAAARTERMRIREHPRKHGAHIDETRVVADLMRTRRGAAHVMLDVGAHFGTSASYFRALDWTVFCFEPDQKNRNKLEGRYGDDKAVMIDPRAVSDKPAESVSFFSSDESTGISGLSAFHSTHRESDRVDVTTVEAILAENKLKHIDFLKIDVEGFDFSVLKGVPWDTCRPDVIECEFEDAKTVPLGHTWRDIADYLCEQGYAVYISEWHPIVRYGVRHDWRRVFPYGAEEMKHDAWGNFLAFKVDPGYKTVQDAFDKLVQTKASAPAASGVSQKVFAPSTTISPSHHFLNAETDARIRAFSPRIFGALVLAKGALQGLWRRRRWTIPALLLILLFAASGFVPILAPYNVLIWGAAAFAIAMFLTLYVGLRSYQHLKTLSGQLSQLNSARVLQQSQSDRKLRAVTDKLRSVDAKFESFRSAIKIDFNGQVEDVIRRHDKIATQAQGLAKKLEEVSADLKSLSSQVENSASSISAEIKALDSKIKESEKAKDDLKRSLNEQAKAGKHLRERVAASERQIGIMRYPDAPSCIVYFGHHKCASRFFRFETFVQIAEMVDGRIRRYEIKNPPFHYTQMDDLDLHNIDLDGLGENGRDIVLFANATERSLGRIQQSTDDWKGLRVLRDPRQVLVSNYFHHKGSHHTELNGWVWDKLKTDKPILQELPKEEGLLYELDNISKQVLENQIFAPFSDDRILTLKIEEFSNAPKAAFAQIATFLEAPDIAGVDLTRTGANPQSGPWIEHFTPKVREIFKERYGQALIDLGYADDMDW